ncbi:TetR/AcrR family transcriptional regulator [Gordonia hydrophobica]|uniref:Helix-turn-helix domain-containing protein n=1 Tax=Gordonia hydrophobica TaxID=40516 RepID=A0ABZ2TXG8_9ACTN|nr:TetR/AcrR family transcriptional regulator [Gordonia hydrophobica]MBM7366381.1 AcrR family transcriptional regulator [Gordonia hydrophobica]
MTSVPSTDQHLRKDAAANRERLLVAGRALFAQRGLGVTLNDVAHHAGVGVGTAYRRFANKEELIDAILERQNEEMEQILHEALVHPNPWDGLVQYLEQSLALQTRDRGMAQIFAGRHGRPTQYDEARDRLAPLVNRVAERARDSGALRDDVTGTDLIFLQIACTAVATVAQDGPRLEHLDDVDQLYRRYLWIALDGMRADARTSELPIGALTTAQTHALLQPTRPD